MTFFDKVSNKAKELADNAKINVRIAEEKRNISELKEMLGELTWNKYCAGAVIDSDIIETCEKIRDAYTTIDNYNAELDKIREKAAEKDSQNTTSSSSAANCTSCGANILVGQKFCSSCGTRIPEEEPHIHKCLSCGTELSENQAFCPMCGIRVENS